MTSVIPVFPLNTVVFPGQHLPLHIFEPRYRQLVQDVLGEDREFGIALIAQGREVGGGAEPVAVGCAVRITEVQELPDGRYNIVLGGITKFRITSEDHSRSYRLANIEPIPEVLSPSERLELEDLRDELAGLLPIGLPGIQIPDGLADEDVVNGVAQLIDIEPLDRLGLLEQPDALARGQALINIFYTRAALPR